MLDSIKVTESSEPNALGRYILDSVELNVQAYQLSHDRNGKTSCAKDDGSDDGEPQFAVVQLPRRDWDGIWES